MPNFHHSFHPTGISPLGAFADLTVREVEDAGLLEVLQTPGVAFGPWRIMEALIDHGNADFVFQEPLGQAREVKTAISGLFGRFVARAYATKYLGYTHFQNIRSPHTRLNWVSRGLVRRVRGLKGDMPDWVAWGPKPGMSIIEAKGCHDAGGPAAALNRAFIQAGRAEIAIGGKVAPFKRFAIATRWGFLRPKPMLPMLSVHDPEAGDEDVSPEQIKELGLGIVRRHCATLLASLGHRGLATHFITAVITDLPTRQSNAIAGGLRLIDALPERSSKGRRFVGLYDDLIGGFVTTNGTILADLTIDEQSLLTTLGMSPIFVGVERRFLKLAIAGEYSELLKEISFEQATISTEADATMRGLGTWIVRQHVGEGGESSA